MIDAENKARILNVNSVIDGELGGGTAERTIRLSEYLALRSYNVSILTLKIGNNIHIKGVDIILIPCINDRFFIPNPLYFFKILKCVKNIDVIHMMGHWSILNILVFFCAKILKKPYVFCPAGSLKILGRSQIFKKIYQKFIGKLIVKSASFVISITKDEGKYFKYIGIPDFKIKLIPNGIEKPVDGLNDFISPFNKLPEKFILYMGRIEFVKGPDLLLEGFLKIEKKFPNMHLVFAGPDNGLKQELEKIIIDSNLSEKIYFMGYVSGALKSHLYYKSHFLVVPSRSEAMSIVALEAGAHGKVAMLTSTCGLHEVCAVSQDLEVEPTAPAIAKGLDRLLSDESALANYSHLWSQYVFDAYSWNKLIAVYEDLFQDVFLGESKLA